MSKSVRKNDFVFIVCTPKYKLKSDNQKGGADCEEDVINGEVLVIGNHRKFIPLLRNGEREKALPSKVIGKYYIDIRDSYDYKENY